MANVTFYLRDRNAKKEIPIRMTFTFDGERLLLSTGLKVHPNNWSESKQRLKPSAEGRAGYNALLDNYGKLVKQIYTEAKLKKMPITGNYIREQYNKRKEGEHAQMDFHRFVKQFIEEGKATKKKCTVKTYGPCWNRIKAFERKTGYKVTFDTINLDFYRRFQDFFYNELKLGINTFGSNIKFVKAVMNDAYERGLHKNRAHQGKLFTKPSMEVDHIYLNEKELGILYKMVLSQNSRLDKVRDLFLVGCYTGLRFSDFTTIESEHIKGNMIQLRTEKTSEDVVIPIHWMVREIMKKYDPPNSLPPVMSNQKLNDYLKELGQLAGLDEEVIMTTSKAGKRVDEKYVKYELIQSHTARRSFATNAYLADVPTLAIMKITGHKTERAFLRYIKVTPEENARRLLEHAFFVK